VSDDGATEGRDFIRREIDADLAAGRFDQIVTRFPPEPNGYLHIGHAKAALLNFGLAREFDGRFHLRFDDTNPAGEDAAYADAIEEDLAWLGCAWGEHRYHASDFFPRMYELAEELVRAGKAYVCDLSAEEIREYRGTLTEPGRPSPSRERTAEENLGLLRRMRAGEFPDGAKTLRAKIDMAAANLNLRDPVMYRISRERHYRTGDDWCIYPMYDWAHGLEDSFEGVTFSLCSLEFENHRPLYDWFLEQLPVHRPRQIEFARFNLTHTVMSKRWLRRLVDDGHVAGWDDPRLPTLRGMRRRGYPPAALRAFCEYISVKKQVATHDYALLEHFVRQDLNRTAQRRMAVRDPLKLVIANYPEGETEELAAINNPEDEAAGTRGVPFGRELWIEREDFMEDPPKKFFRLAPGREVRLRSAYFVTCDEVVKDDEGEVVEVRCTYDPATRGGSAPDGRKVKATLHWVAAAQAIDAELREYGHLFRDEDPGAARDADDWLAGLDPGSLRVRTAKCEPSLADFAPGEVVQFERLGYYCVDPDSTPGAPVFDRTVGLRDTRKKRG